MSAGRPGAYARAVEAALARARGRPGVLSPRDWARVADWCARGIPLSVVLEALEEAAARSRKRVSEVRSLAFVAPAVEEAWRAVAGGRLVPASAPLEREEGSWPWARAEVGCPPEDALARWLTSARARFRDGISLAALDAELEERLPDLAGMERTVRAAAEVDRALASFRSRMTEAAFAATRRRALGDVLRRALGLPPRHA